MTSNLRQRAVHGVFWFGGSRIVVQLITWVITVAVARVLSPSDYGLFGMALMYIGLIDFLNDMGLGTALVQKQNLTEEQLSSLFWFTNVTGLFFFLLSAATAQFVAGFFHQPLLTPLLWFISINFIITSIQQVPWNILTRAVDFKKRSAAETVGTLLAGLTTILMAYRGLGVWALAWGLLARSIIITILVVFLARWRPMLAFNWSELRQLLNFGVTITASRIIYFFSNSSPIVIIGKLLGDQALGYYSLATRLSCDLSDRALSVIIQVALPVYSEIQNQPQRLKTAFLTTTDMACALIFPFLGGLIVTGDDAVPLLLGQKWSPIIGPLKLLAAAGFFMTLHSLMVPLVLARNRVLLVLWFNLICLICLPASFLLAAKFGLLGVCSVWVIVYPLLVLYWIFQILRIIECRWAEFWWALRPAVLGTASMVTTVVAVETLLLPKLDHAMRLFMIIPLGAAVYLAVSLWLSSRLLKDILKMLHSMRGFTSAT